MATENETDADDSQEQVSLVPRKYFDLPLTPEIREQIRTGEIELGPPDSACPGYRTVRIP